MQEDLIFLPHLYLDVIIEGRNLLLILFNEERNGEASLAILIDLTEPIGFQYASRLNICLSNVRTRRPLTHELFRNIIVEMGARVKKIVINEVNDLYNIYADIHYKYNDKMIVQKRVYVIDALILATHIGAPVCTTKEAVEKSREFALEVIGDLMLKSIDLSKKPKN